VSGKSHTNTIKSHTNTIKSHTTTNATADTKSGMRGLPPKRRGKVRKGGEEKKMCGDACTGLLQEELWRLFGKSHTNTTTHTAANDTTTNTTTYTAANNTTTSAATHTATTNTTTHTAANDTTTNTGLSRWSDRK